MSSGECYNTQNTHMHTTFIHIHTSIIYPTSTRVTSLMHPTRTNNLANLTSTFNASSHRSCLCSSNTLAYLHLKNWQQQLLRTYMHLTQLLHCKPLRLLPRHIFSCCHPHTNHQPLHPRRHNFMMRLNLDICPTPFQLLSQHILVAQINQQTHTSHHNLHHHYQNPRIMTLKNTGIKFNKTLNSKWHNHLSLITSQQVHHTINIPTPKRFKFTKLLST